jgi:hypothetical protein
MKKEIQEYRISNPDEAMLAGMPTASVGMLNVQCRSERQNAETWNTSYQARDPKLKYLSTCQHVNFRPV